MRDFLPVRSGYGRKRSVFCVILSLRRISRVSASAGRRRTQERSSRFFATATFAQNDSILRLMRLRDSAAVVLAGWILLAPSIDCARRGLQRETPLSEWEHVDSFSSRESCENFRATVIDQEKNDSGNVYVQRYSYSICVQDDDPRLKGE